MTCSPLPAAPPVQARLVTFIDGQNVFGCAKELFGYKYATYDPRLLSAHVAARLSCDLVEVRFYTGVHTSQGNAGLYNWWQAKLRRMAAGGVVVTQRTLAYTHEQVALPDGTTRRIAVGREKGIDLRIGLDMVRLARARAYDAVVVFSQDNDLGEATDEVKRIAKDQGRFVTVASAFPCGVAAGSRGRRRGIDRTDWIRFTRAEYDACCEALPAGAGPHASLPLAAVGLPPLSALGAALQAAVTDAPTSAGGSRSDAGT